MVVTELSSPVCHSSSYCANEMKAALCQEGEAWLTHKCEGKNFRGRDSYIMQAVPERWGTSCQPQADVWWLTGQLCTMKPANVSILYLHRVQLSSQQQTHYLPHSDRAALCISFWSKCGVFPTFLAAVWLKLSLLLLPSLSLTSQVTSFKDKGNVWDALSDLGLLIKPTWTCPTRDFLGCIYTNYRYFLLHFFIFPLLPIVCCWSVCFSGPCAPHLKEEARKSSTG